LKMNLQSCFIKEKGNPLFFTLFLGSWPAGPTSSPPPLPSIGPNGRCPSFPSARPKLARSPLFLGRPSNERSHARVPARSAANARARSLHHRCIGPGRQSSPSSHRNERLLPFSPHARRCRGFPFFTYRSSIKQATPLLCSISTSLRGNRARPTLKP
jgi:hypothetical protein